jgi:hypothetical protein
MKLIIEQYDDIKQSVSEALNEATGRKDVYIEGVYAQTIKNRNGRIYPKPILEAQINAYMNDYVKTNKAMGELNHPNTLSINPKEVCIKVENLHLINEENVHGKAKLTNTPNGNLVRNLVIDDGIQLGVSTRGVGSVKHMREADIIQNDYFLKCWDVVTDPSAPDAFVNGIMESKEWLFVDGILIEQEIESLQKQVNKSVRQNKLNTAVLEEIFKKVLSQNS